MVGAGSFGTAIAILLERAGVRTTLLCRTSEQAAELEGARENKQYLEGVGFPQNLKVRTFGAVDEQFTRADLLFIAVPSKGMGEALAEIERLGVAETAGVVSLAKGLVSPHGTPPTVALERAFGPERTACVGGPAHAREMVEDTGAGLVCASHSGPLGAPCGGGVPARGRGVRGVQRPGGGGARAGWPRTPPPWRWAPPSRRG